MSYKITARDRAIADGVDLPVDRALMCSAHGCPRPWSVSGDRGKACSAHYGAEPRDWPRITEALQREEVDRARQAVLPPPPAPSLEQRRAALQRIASIGRPAQARPDLLAWARTLHERHQRGERLTPAQVEAYRVALRFAELRTDRDEGGQP